MEECVHGTAQAMTKCDFARLLQIINFSSFFHELILIFNLKNLKDGREIRVVGRYKERKERNFEKGVERETGRPVGVRNLN